MLGAYRQRFAVVWLHRDAAVALIPSEAWHERRPMQGGFVLSIVKHLGSESGSGTYQTEIAAQVRLVEVKYCCLQFIDLFI